MLTLEAKEGKFGIHFPRMRSTYGGTGVPQKEGGSSMMGWIRDE